MKIINLTFISISSEGLLYEVEYKTFFGKEILKKVFISKIGENFSSLAVFWENGNNVPNSIHTANIIFHHYLVNHKK